MKRNVVAGLIVAIGLVPGVSGIARAQQPAAQPGLQVIQQQPAAQPAPQPTPQPGSQLSGPTKLAELRNARELQAAVEDAAARETIPLQLQVVVARYQGEKRVSSLPYLLSINSGPAPNFGINTSGSLRMGTKIAVPSTTVSEGKSTTTFEYRDVGTSIDAGAARRPDGSFNVSLTVADSGVYPDDQKTSASSAGLPVIRSFQSTNRLILKDGQMAQFTAAADRLSGETVRVEVTLRVQK
jgi:hypothetical protein